MDETSGRFESLEIPQELREELRVRQQKQLERPHKEICRYDSVVLTYGLGPAVYLTLDGRLVIWDYATDAEPRFANQWREVGAYLTIGARNLDLPQLIDLIPKPSPGVGLCTQCNGQRWTRIATTGPEVVCWSCSGFGWISSDENE